MGRLIAWPLGIIGIILLILAACGVINAAISAMLELCVPMIILSVAAFFVPN